MCVARRLFQKQTSPWVEDALFAQWQSELPGVGTLYQVQTDMLFGVAVCTDNGDARVWQYLPSEKLPNDPLVCFHALFAVKERWLLRELEPYLDHMLDSSPTTSQAELLLRYTKSVTDDREVLAMKLYVKK